VLDRPTRRVLGFASRRLAADRLTVQGAAREASLGVEALVPAGCGEPPARRSHHQHRDRSPHPALPLDPHPAGRTRSALGAYPQDSSKRLPVTRRQ
jgi:hypothetical protein